LITKFEGNKVNLKHCLLSVKSILYFSLSNRNSLNLSSTKYNAFYCVEALCASQKAITASFGGEHSALARADASSIIKQELK